MPEHVKGTVEEVGGKRRFWWRPDPAGSVGQIDLLWVGARRWTAAIVFFLFPFVFMVDEAVETAISPVLPAVVVLILLVVGLPFLLMEVGTRKLRKLHEDLRPRRVVQYRNSSRAAFVVGLLWFVAWLALGA